MNYFSQNSQLSLNFIDIILKFIVRVKYIRNFNINIFLFIKIFNRERRNIFPNHRYIYIYPAFSHSYLSHTNRDSRNT